MTTSLVHFIIRSSLLPFMFSISISNSDYRDDQHTSVSLSVHELDQAYPNFFDAFSAVFSDGRNLFEHVRHGKPKDQIGNYEPTISISDGSAVPANSFHRKYEWAFRFTMEDALDDANKRYQQVDDMIRTVLNNNRIKYTKSILPFDHGDTPILSYQYKDQSMVGYRVEFLRFTSGNMVYEEVIIYHSQYSGYL